MSISTTIKNLIKFKEVSADGALTALYEWTKDVSGDTDNVNIWAKALGTDGAGQAIAGGGTDTYDTSAGLTTALGTTGQTMSRLIYLIFQNMSTTATMTLTVNNYNGTDDLVVKVRPGGSLVFTDENNGETSQALGDITVAGTAGQKYKLIVAGLTALASA